MERGLLKKEGALLFFLFSLSKGVELELDVYTMIPYPTLHYPTLPYPILAHKHNIT